MNSTPDNAASDGHAIHSLCIFNAPVSIRGDLRVGDDHRHTAGRDTITILANQSVTDTHASGPRPQPSLHDQSPVTRPTLDPQSTRDGWWRRLRKRGLVVALSTIIAAVTAVFTWIGWTPW